MTAQRVLEVARSQLGTVEAPPNSNRTKYGAAYGMNGVAWCAIWCWWCFQQAGAGHLIPKSAYTPAIADWFRARGRWGTAPRVGAVVLFDFPNDGVNRISHIGIVEAVNRDGTIISLEGNTSAGTSGSQRDGGGVFRRTRRTGIVGYGYPAYPPRATVVSPTVTTRAVQQTTRPTTPATPPTSTAKRRDAAVLHSVHVSGQGSRREGLMIGRTSAIYSRGWVSLLATGGTGATAHVFFQDDFGGLADHPMKVEFRDGWSSRDWKQAPDGTTQVNVVYDAPDGAVLVFEAEPR